MRKNRIAIGLAGVLGLGVLGCGIKSRSVPETANQLLSGTMIGGQQPISGATVQLYAVGTAGDGSAATPLIGVSVLTDANGSFSIPAGSYTCPSSSTLVYLTGMGGNPGLSAGTTNSDIGMMAALGQCGNLSAATYISINELTTVASVYALSPFMTSYLKIGSSSSDQPALASAFATVNELVNTSTGTIPGPTLPSGSVAQTSKVNSFADSIAACINSTGGHAGDLSNCGILFTAASSGSTVPANTIDAILAIEQSPTRNVAAIFNLVAPAPPFQPVLTSAPSDWSLGLLPKISLGATSSLVGIGNTLTGTITLAQAAPTGGLSVNLSSGNPGYVSVTTPAIVQAGATSGTFSYTGVASGSATLTASASNYSPDSLQVTATNLVVQLGSVSTLAPGQQVSLPVTLSASAPVGGIVVNLASSNAAVATVSPSSVTIPAGATRPSTYPAVTAVNIGSSSLSAATGGYAPATAAVSVTVTATLPTTLSAKVGSSATGTLSISAAAPLGGLTFTLATDNAAIATADSSVTIPQGATQANFVLSGVVAGSTTLRARSSGIAEADATVLSTPTMAQAIQHVVVIFDENVSFDHYFATYPVAANPSGETAFTAVAGTPTPAGLSGLLLTANPNSINVLNGSGAANPFRLDPKQAATADQEHTYTPEQVAFNNGAMDLFPYSIGAADSPTLALQTGASSVASTRGLTMGYYDGNTVTALWNYAQHYALGDHFFESTFGPSTTGALNLISGQTNGAVSDAAGSTGGLVGDGYGGYTLTDDPDPTNDICANAGIALHMTGKNIGDMLTASKVSWGWFQGGFDLTLTNPNGSDGCGRFSLTTPTGNASRDFVPHHEPFQYYASTANPNHTRPTSVSTIGLNADAANHQYDLHDFTDALAAGKMPSVSFLKAPAYQDGHAGYSDPLDEQTFLVNVINKIEQSPFWSSTAIVIAYDDSDGWYDHLSNVVNASQTNIDQYTSWGLCSSATAPLSGILPGVLASTTHAQGRCGYGPRLPLLVLSPWARKNFVYSTVTDQTSIMKLVEDIFLSGQRLGGGSFDSIAGPLDGAFDFSVPAAPNGAIVTLDPTTGAVTSNN